MTLLTRQEDPRSLPRRASLVQKPLLQKALLQKHRCSMQLGASMVEVVVGALLAGILAMWAFPAYNHSVQNKQLHVVRNELISLLHTARKEAVVKRTPVVLCPLSSTALTCGTPSDWSNGWLLFFDRAEGQADSGAVVSDADLIIATDPVYADASIAFPHGKIVFNRNGFVLKASGAFAICDDRGEDYARGIILSKTGSVQIAEDSNKDTDFIPEDREGNNIVCEV